MVANIVLVQFNKVVEHIPFREYIIQRRKPLRVKASGIMKIKRIRAEVDSNSNSTMPIE
jgi:hypothetical protein